jgi:hypothetical protein
VGLALKNAAKVETTNTSMKLTSITTQGFTPISDNLPGPAPPEARSANRPNWSELTKAIENPREIAALQAVANSNLISSADLRIAIVAIKAANKTTTIDTIPKSSRPTGSAPKSGTAGSGPTCEPNGDISEPEPIEKPTPVNQEAP